MAKSELLLLYKLIQSLSKAEKRYFRLTTQMQEGAKTFMQLYDILDSCSNFDEEVTQRVANELTSKSIEPARKYLYANILKSLRLFEEENSLESQLLNMIQECKILFNKGHIDLYNKRLAKAIQLAVKHDKHLFYLLLSKLELQNLVSLQFSDITETELIRKQEQFKALLKQENIHHEQAMLYEILWFRYLKNGMVRSSADIEKLNDLLLEESQILQQSRQKTFESKRLHLQFQSTYFLAVGNSKGSIAIFYELIDLFEQHQTLWIDNPMYYIYCIEGILTDLRAMEKWEEMAFFIAKLQNIPALSESTRYYLHVLIFSYQVNLHNDLEQTHQALAWVNSQLNEIQKSIGQVPAKLQIKAYYTLARLYYFTRDYTVALQYVNEILAVFQEDLGTSLYAEIRILNLLIHHRLGNFDYLSYDLVSLERKLKIEKKYHALEKVIIQVFRNVFTLNSRSQKLWNTFNDLSKMPYHQPIIKNLKLDKWVYRQLFEKHRNE
eukprot:GDKJ01007975.1.p1 GENE.GDKJ01007975.1~~GDKJ01007975.1.p1  ORF type:complete len:495 (+),score=23.25 GDKJ01007975.1:305-1789(+)